VYLDSIQQGATLAGLGAWAGALSNTSTVIGAASTIPSELSNGFIQHAAVWDRALTPAEVLSVGVL
jgi:hypothetical protein